MDYDKTQLPETYARSRKLSPETIALWMDAVEEFLGPTAGAVPEEGKELHILDLGCGTGRFSVPLGERFGARVLGVEPSDKMRRQAEANAAHPGVTYVTGRAEAIPCEDASFDAAFLSMVVHHFQSPLDAARELRRVLRPDGYAFIRNSFSGRLDSVRYYDFFPSGKAADNARLPDMDELVGIFQSAGFKRVAHRVITQQIDPSLSAHYERIKLRSLSTFEFISDEEFREGIKTMEKAAQAETSPTPVMEDIDLLVFQRCEKGRRDG